MLLQLICLGRRNRPATPLFQDIARTLAEAEANEAFRVAVIKGTDQVCVAGSDLNELMRVGSDEPVETPRFQVSARIRACPKPFVVAVEG